MTNQGTLRVATRGDREIVMTRVFDAPRTLVWKAFTTPALLRQWLLGPPGWSMVVCEVALHVGGHYRYVWRDASGNEMGVGGIFREIVPPERIVATEKFDQSWYPGEAVGTVALLEQGSQTELTQTILYESRAARDAVLKSPMEQGVAASYDRLAGLLSSTSAGGNPGWNQGQAQ
jgi:uncharacterized protein YndB with AHSA1/START domain